VAGGDVPFFNKKRKGKKRMEKEAKKVYVPPHVTVHRVMLEQAQAASPVSVELTNQSVQQDDEWEDESSLPAGGSIWLRQ
jgi:chorismate-pyruvate lyase